MKVYILGYADYDSRYIAGVFSDVERVQEALLEVDLESIDYYGVQVFEVDAGRGGEVEDDLKPEDFMTIEQHPNERIICGFGGDGVGVIIVRG